MLSRVSIFAIAFLGVAPTRSCQPDDFNELNHATVSGSHRLILAISLLLCAPSLSQAAPAADLWPLWEAHDNTSTVSLDHTPWSDFLARYVRKDNEGTVGVAYDEVTQADRAQLSEYVQLPFWINLYNSVTVRIILDEWPVKSIRDIKDGLFSAGPWTGQRLTVEGEKISLNDIEHRILRPIWRDPRLHYALNCASTGCPDLLPTAFTRDNAEQLMTDAALTFINHPRAASVKDGKLTVSSIYHWFKEDFGGSDSGVLSHLREYASADLSNRLQSIKNIDDHRYDWSINLVN